MSEDTSEKAISDFKKALGSRGFAVSADVVQALRKRLEARETKEEIRRALRTGERSTSDVAKGAEALAVAVAERLEAKKKRTADWSDILETIRRHFCNFWPICH